MGINASIDCVATDMMTDSRIAPSKQMGINASVDWVATVVMTDSLASSQHVTQRQENKYIRESIGLSSSWLMKLIS